MNVGLNINDYEKCIQLGYTVSQVEEFGLKCHCGGVVMPIFEKWDDIRDGRKCKVYGISICRCTDCLADSPVGGVDDYVEYVD